MAEIVGPPKNKIRNRPIAPELRDVLNGAADAAGIDKVVIVSGGQTSSRDPRLKNKVGGWTGSRRHDDGRAADVDLVRKGQLLSFTDADGSQVAGFVTAAAARGAIGIGAGEGYMGRNTIHVGFGQTTADRTEVVWGANNAAANAPRWLRTAARAGWANPTDAGDFVGFAAPGCRRSVVAARDGLWLRKGAGLGFDRARLLEAGTELTVLGFDGEWARVCLQGDDLIDGHVYAAYLRTAEEPVGDGGEPIIDEGEEGPLGDASKEGREEAEGTADSPARRRARPSRRGED